MSDNNVSQSEAIPRRGRPTIDVRKSERFTLRLTEQQLNKLDYWSIKLAISKTDLLVLAFDHYVSWVNADYDLPTAEVVRLNQLMETIEGLASTTHNLENTVVSGFDSLIGLAKGGNYLIDDEDGEI